MDLGWVRRMSCDGFGMGQEDVIWVGQEGVM